MTKNEHLKLVTIAFIFAFGKVVSKLSSGLSAAIAHIKKKDSTNLKTISLIMCVAFLTAAVNAPMANACSICVPFPKTTLADVLNEKDSVILAREKIGKPFYFRTVEVLKGENAGDDFKAYIYSVDRRKLSKNLNDVAVFGKKSSDDDWLYVAYADREYQAFVREIILQAGNWQNFKGSLRRIDFFAKRLTDDNPRIHDQAYLEVGRAPYSSIKRIAGSIPRQKIRKFLTNWSLVEWHSLYILMLGQSRHPDDRAYIRNELEECARHQFKLNLSAWVTAFIESQPDSGVEEIEKLYFSSGHRTQDELQEVLKGFSVLGSEGGIPPKPEILDRRQRIIKSYATLLDNYPMMAGLVAKDLTNWKTRALVTQLSKIKKSKPVIDPGYLFAVDYYLSMAPKFPAIKGIH